MSVYEITAEVLMQVQAESKEDAIEMAESELANVVLSWDITNVTV